MGGEEKSPTGLGDGEKQREERKEGEKQREERKEREGEKGKKNDWSSFDLQYSESRNLSDQEEKFVYSTRATLQVVEILSPLIISTLRAVWLCFLP